MSEGDEYSKMLERLATGVRESFEGHPQPPGQEWVENLVSGNNIFMRLNGLKVAKWLRDLAAMTELEASPPERFFMVLHGVVAELPDFLERFRSGLEIIFSDREGFEAFFGDLKLYKFDELAEKMDESKVILDQILLDFADDSEKAVIRLLRDLYCHIVIESYIPKAAFSKKKSKWKYNDEKYLAIARSISSDEFSIGDFKLQLTLKLALHVHKLRKLADLTDEITFRFGKFGHKLVDTDK